MKTLGRILIILTAFVLVMGITYTVVSAANTASSSTGTPTFEGGEGLPRPQGVQPQFPNGERPEFPGGEGREFRGDRGGGFGWILGAVKNMSIVAIIVAAVVWLKNFQRKRDQETQQVSE